MPSKSAVALLIIPLLLLFFVFTFRMRANTESSYVKLEVKGRLVQKGAAYAVEASDAHFADTKVMVVLERSEDKNRGLDRRLESLKGRIVVANGFPDCRRIGHEWGVIYLYLSNESQISAEEDD
jgi:hypothetical protein